MYEKIKITENTLQILALFTNDFSKEYYIREVQKLLGISPRTAQLVLEDLENKGIIESETKGKIKAYKIKISEHSKKYFVLVEHYKAIGFLENRLIIKEIIEKITPCIKGIGIIFGSYAKGTERKNSDLDIFVVGDYDKNEVKKIAKNFNIEISIKCYPMKTFEETLNKDILLREIIKNHIVFVNAEEFVQKVLDG